MEGPIHILWQSIWFTEASIRSRRMGDTGLAPVQVLERPVRQRVKVVKDVDSGETLGNFRFKIYLRSNLERLYCDEDGAITWTDKNGTAVDVDQYHRVFPELVQKLYTVKTERRVLEVTIMKNFSMRSGWRIRTSGTWGARW